MIRRSSRTAVVAGTGAPSACITPHFVLLMAIGSGLAAGLLEVASMVVRTELLEKGFVMRSRHFVWMVPLSDLAIFGGWGLIVSLVGWRVRRLPAIWVIAGFLFLACMSQLLLVQGLHSVTCMLLSVGIAYRAARWIGGRLSALSTLTRRGVPVLAATLAALATATVARDPYAGRGLPAPGPSPATSSRAPNVLLIVLDTVRADHLSLYGYDRDTTPNLRRLASQGVCFRRAWATAPWTLPSHASLFTGRWPHELGVERLGRLDDTYPTLAEFLGARGHATAGFVANAFNCRRETGLGRGFATYRDGAVSPAEILRASSLGWLLARNLNRAREEFLWAFSERGPARIGLDFSRKTAAAVNEEFLDWLDRGEKGSFFAFLNYFDAHDPYLPPERPARPFGAAPRSRGEFAMLRDWPRWNKKALDPASLSLARDAYDDCLASLDRELGRLFDELLRRDVLDETLLIVTADHGEQFGEHGAYGHGQSLYEPEVHVPLVIAFPGRVPRGLVVHEAVSLRDVPATIVDLIGAADQSPFPGTSLSATWDGPPAPASPSPNTPLAELEKPIENRSGATGRPSPRGPLKAVLAGSAAYLRDGDGAEELYDLDLDPAESRNLIGSKSAGRVIEQCRRILGRLADETGTPERPPGRAKTPRDPPAPDDP